MERSGQRIFSWAGLSEFACAPGSSTVLHAAPERSGAWPGDWPCGRGSAGRASPCQGEGRGFESRRPLGDATRRHVWSRVESRSCGGVAEWLRQGPAKPCTRVRFPSPPLAAFLSWGNILSGSAVPGYRVLASRCCASSPREACRIGRSRSACACRTARLAPTFTASSRSSASPRARN